MIRTIKIDDSSNKAQALLEFLLTLDFVNENNDDYVLTAEQHKTLQERRENHLSGKSKSHSWEDVRNSLGKVG
ncbi:MAG: hypothetical protein ACI837_001010 [Crocinitomicaceae bacterium]|jgi:hypothetical protein